MRTLLIVDDYEGVLSALTWILENRGHRVITARSGSTALALAQSEAIYGALIDVQMPGMDGYATCQALRKLPGHTSCPVWLMTGAYSIAAERHARQCGALGLLKKPFDADTVQQAMESHWASLAPAVPSASVVTTTP